ncbi:hypothetical protein FHS14_003021 [Paenibacillus baekrokdamisoli]|nr:hypothetical protein [Paenibacillus baekrokdamisoli]MBB3070026.1 hypothetical protein [Paenibacillus baekrokdamisoli]
MEEDWIREWTDERFELNKGDDNPKIRNGATAWKRIGFGNGRTSGSN